MIRERGEVGYDGLTPASDLTENILRVFEMVLEERGLPLTEFERQKPYLEDEIYTHLITRFLEQVNLELYEPNGNKIEEYGLDIYYEEPSENLNPEKELKEYTERVYDTISRLDAPLEGTRYEFRIESKPGAPKVGKR